MLWRDDDDRQSSRTKENVMATRFAVWRLFDDRSGLVDFEGIVEAEDEQAAEDAAELLYPCDREERLELEIDDEEP